MKTISKIFLGILATLILATVALPVFAFTNLAHNAPVIPLGINYFGGNLNISQNGVNLTSGNLNWSNNINANPGEILSFSIGLQAQGRDAHNVLIKNTLPPGLVFTDEALIVLGASNYFGNNLDSGIFINTIPAGQFVIINYHVQVVGRNITIQNTATVTSSETSQRTASAQVVISNNPLTDRKSVV